jgi:hypothetical protein
LCSRDLERMCDGAYLIRTKPVGILDMSRRSFRGNDGFFIVRQPVSRRGPLPEGGGL